MCGEGFSWLTLILPPRYEATPLTKTLALLVDGFLVLQSCKTLSTLPSHFNFLLITDFPVFVFYSVPRS